ncbi:MAG: glycosyltransferase family 39 protein [Dehalococcoidia bacterium]
MSKETQPRDKKIPAWFCQRENMALVFLAGVLLLLHLIALFQEDELIYDESANVAEANYVLYGDEMDPFYIEWGERNGFLLEDYEEVSLPHHMPLGKLILAASIGLIGDNNLGWRIGPVLFGTTSIIIFYLICQKLSSRRWFPLVATFIFAFENLCFVMSGLALQYVYGVTFLLLAFLLYLHGRLIPAAIILALGALCKIVVAFGGIVIVVHWLLVRREPTRNALKFLIIAPLAFVALLPLFDYWATGHLIYPWDRIYNYVDLHADPSLSQGPAAFRSLFGAMLPWDWLISPQSFRIWRDPSYEMTVNWPLWGLIIPLILYMSFEAVRQRWHSLAVFALLWFVCGYLPWFIIYWGFDRVSYPFYFYPIVPAVCLAAGYAIFQIGAFGWECNRAVLKWGVIALPFCWLAAHFAMFWMMAPIV